MASIRGIVKDESLRTLMMSVRIVASVHGVECESELRRMRRFERARFSESKVLRNCCKRDDSALKILLRVDRQTGL
jgi:hypothetical protein